MGPWSYGKPWDNRELNVMEQWSAGGLVAESCHGGGFEVRRLEGASRLTN